eukprot:2191886-Alexandrium_andersonii.AAC.1
MSRLHAVESLTVGVVVGIGVGIGIDACRRCRGRRRHRDEVLVQVGRQVDEVLVDAELVDAN